MACKTIAVANMKGGVGKTTLVVFLSEAFAADDAALKILVVDADPQASASVSLVGDETLKEIIMSGRTLDAFLDDNLVYPPKPITKRLADIVRRNVSSTTHNNVPLEIDLLPCGFHLRLVEKATIRDFSKHGLGPDAYEMRLWDMWLKELVFLKKRYDYIVIDCAPSLSVVNEMMIRSADLVLLPTIPDFISAFGLNAFLNSVWHFPIANLPKPTRLPYVVISKYEKKLNQHKASAQDLAAEASEPSPQYAIFKTYVEKSVRFSEALAKGDDCPTFTNKYSPQMLNEVVWPLLDEIKGVLHAF